MPIPILCAIPQRVLLILFSVAAGLLTICNGRS